MLVPIGLVRAREAVDDDVLRLHEPSPLSAIPGQLRCEGVRLGHLQLRHHLGHNFIWKLRKLLS